MLGYVVMEGQGEGDRVLRSVAGLLASERVQLAGAVQINVDRGPGLRCHMDLAVLGSGQELRISQDLGREATGCRLDAHGLEDAVARVEEDLNSRIPDLLIINKFGKQEADGRGFRPVIAQALAMGVPVLTGIGQFALEPFKDFAGDHGEALENSEAALLSWCRNAVAARAN